MPQPARSSPSFGLVNRRPLFLDLDADSYFLLQPEEEADLLAMLAAGTQAPDLSPVHRRRPSGDLDLPLGKMPGFNLSDIVRILTALRQARRGLKQRPLAELIGSILARAPRGQNRAISAQAVALRFHIARRWLPHPRNCLTDSLALLTFLIDHGFKATLVFGAKLDPFAAHCWLEADDLLLNDQLDRIEGFTPVAVLGPC